MTIFWRKPCEHIDFDVTYSEHYWDAAYEYRTCKKCGYETTREITESLRSKTYVKPTKFDEKGGD